MADIEYNYRTYQSNLFIDSGKFNVGSDILELGLATAGTLVGANYTKTLLSTILTKNPTVFDRPVCASPFILIDAKSASKVSNHRARKYTLFTEAKLKFSIHNFNVHE